jgi:phosphoenolpyruvate-protein phosphotransferase
VWADEELSTPRYTSVDPDGERDRLDRARAQAREELAGLKEKVARETQAGEAEVFAAHQMFLDDKALLKRALRAIEGGQNAEASWMDAVEFFAAQLESLPDPTLSARSVDVRDVGRRVLRHLLGRTAAGLQLEQPAVIVARDLSPSQTAGLDKGKVLAFCTAEGGPTSHTAILAKALGLPAVVALGQELLSVGEGEPLLVDGGAGEVVIAPDEAALGSFRQLAEQGARRRERAQASALEPAVTQDGLRVEVVANIGGPQDARAALAYGAEGVGLFRTEFLFLERDSLPGEAEQVKAYRQVLEALPGRPVVVRTLDIGGDKAVSYLGFSEEANPFLGWRAIRMNEGRPDVFRSQVRALLQAGAGADLRIMAPMVSNLEEVQSARRLLEEASLSLRAEGLPCAEEVQFGVMVEVPSVAVMAEVFARHVDFFSIGTNDLTQYTLAVDRTNARVAPLASPFHPAVLRLIEMTIQAAHRHDKWVGVCGELAGEVLAVPVLLGLGLDEFSMAPALIPAVKQALRNCTVQVCQEIAQQALACSTTAEVLALLKAQAEALKLF